jgi:exopolysaccharide biosynthesis polyprenyl glycosylphosphotransferase
MFERLARRLASSILLGDVLLTLFCLYLASNIRANLDFGNELGEWQTALSWKIYLLVSVIWLIIFSLLEPQRYFFRSHLADALSRLLASIAISSCTFAGVLYLTIREVSRLQFLYFVVLNAVILITFHVLIRIYISYRASHVYQRKVLLVGTTPAGLKLFDEFSQHPWIGLQVIGYMGDKIETNNQLQYFGPIENTPQVVIEQQIDEVVFALPPQERDSIAHLSFQLQQQPVMLHMAPDIIDLAFARTPVQSLGGVPVISLRESPLTESQRTLKRAFDIIVSSVLLLILSPVFLIIAVLIKCTSEGPIFFLQERIGENGQRFHMIKFRSMYQDAERRWKEVVKYDEQGNIIHKVENDPRVTPIGRKLRKTSLDELPQLVNVLKGEMSLVGPRPEMPYIVAEYEPWQWQRFRVPPGITGWWQVNGRSDKPMHLNTSEDLYYIQHYSFWLDLQIILRTVVVVIRGQGAY